MGAVRLELKLTSQSEWIKIFDPRDWTVFVPSDQTAANGAPIRIDLDESLVGQAARERRPIVVPDLRAVDLDPHLRILHDAGWQSLVAVPMLREDQIVGKVELPLGMPIVVGGIRSATLQIIATATLAAYIADEGLGRFIFEGLKTRDYAEMLGGSILVIILALVVDGCFAITQRLVVPAGVRAARATELRSRPTRPRAALGQPIQEGNRT